MNIPLDQMAQILAIAFCQPREPTVSIERAGKLGARNYDGIGDRKDREEVQKSKRFVVGLRKRLRAFWRQSLILSMDRWLRLLTG